MAAGRYFDLRKSFPDLEYRAHDFRVFYDEAEIYSDDGKKQQPLLLSDDDSSGGGTPIERLQRAGRGGGGSSGGAEITVRFTTMVTGTFRGAPLRLRSMILEPNGKVMKCPPTR